MSDQRVKVGITQGDTNGVGWEVILKIVSDSRICEICTPIIYGCRNVAEFYKKGIGELEQFTFNIVKSAAEARDGKINLVECGAPASAVTPGVASNDAGTAAITALVKAAEELKSGALDAIVTAPFNKESVQSSEFTHTGHTEYMASQFEGESMMMMCSELLRVGLVTKHLPLNQIAGAITKEIIVKDLKGLRKTLRQDFSVVEPRIAVLSLNPHSGDGGLLGDEEMTTIKPAIEEAYKGGVFAFGPFAADGFFSAGTYKKYDAVLAMYHDQGLIPFKTLSPEGVNFTAGLEAVRTSPDHGVAYDIAGKDLASPDSMRNAIYMAVDVVRSRAIYTEITANPLEHTELERERGGRPMRETNHRESGLPRESRREFREPRERREPREFREPREQREPREPREFREPREPREPREQREPREPRAERAPRQEQQRATTESKSE